MPKKGLKPPDVSPKNLGKNLGKGGCPTDFCPRLDLSVDRILPPPGTRMGPPRNLGRRCGTRMDSTSQSWELSLGAGDPK